MTIRALLLSILLVSTATAGDLERLRQLADRADGLRACAQATRASSRYLATGDLAALRDAVDAATVPLRTRPPEFLEGRGAIVAGEDRATTSPGLVTFCITRDCDGREIAALRNAYRAGRWLAVAFDVPAGESVYSHVRALAPFRDRIAFVAIGWHDLSNIVYGIDSQVRQTEIDALRCLDVPVYVAVWYNQHSVGGWLSHRDYLAGLPFEPDGYVIRGIALPTANWRVLTSRLREIVGDKPIVYAHVQPGSGVAARVQRAGANGILFRD